MGKTDSTISPPANNEDRSLFIRVDDACFEVSVLLERINTITKLLNTAVTADEISVPDTLPALVLMEDLLNKATELTDSISDVVPREA